MAIKTIMVFWGRICVKGKLAQTVAKKLSPKMKKHHTIITRSYLKHCHQYQRNEINARQFWKLVQEDLGVSMKHEHLVKHHVEARKPNKGVIELLKKLKKNYRLMVVTNTYKEYFEHAHKKYKLDKLFDDMVLSYKVKARMPEPPVYKDALKKAKCKPAECLMIMDKKQFLVPAQKLGMKTMLYKNQKDLKDRLKRLGVKW